MVDVWPRPLRDGLLRLALRDAARPGSGADPEDIELLRAAVAEMEGYGGRREE